MIEFMFLGVNGSCQESGGGNTSILVRGSEGCVCIDLSCNLAEVVAAEPEAVILTHEHIDHVYGLPSFLHQSWLRGRKKPLKIYVPKGMEAIPEGMISLFHLREKKGIFDIEVAAESNISVGTMNIFLFKTNHTDTSCGVAIADGGKTLVYSSDTRPSVNGIDTDVLIHEASGTSENEETLIRKGHSSGADAGKAAKDVGAIKLYLCHLPMEGKEAVLEDAKRFYPGAEIPQILKWYKV